MRSSEIGAGVRHKDVHRLQLALDARAHRFDGIEARDIGGDLDRASTGALDLRANGGERRLVAPVYDDERALAREELRDRRADAARASRDECDAIAKEHAVS